MVGADTPITASGFTACQTICRSVPQHLELKGFSVKAMQGKESCTVQHMSETKAVRNMMH